MYIYSCSAKLTVTVAATFFQPTAAAVGIATAAVGIPAAGIGQGRAARLLMLEKKSPKGFGERGNPEAESTLPCQLQHHQREVRQQCHSRM